MTMLDYEPSVSSVDIPLKLHQDSSMDRQSELVAQLADVTGIIPHNVARPANDGTNACAFLSVKMADEIHKLTEKYGANSNGVWLNVCKVAERVISEFPCLINPHRDIGELYDVLSAYQIIRDNNCGIGEYEYSEEIISGEHVFSEKQDILNDKAADTGHKPATMP